MLKGSLCLPPGFRFHPTDEELILHYLTKRLAAAPCPVPIIADVDIYKFNPWNLPRKAMFGEREWYFFSPRDRKYPNGVRPNRAAASGYWKATGTDKPITTSNGNESIGVKKALVFYEGKPPKGVKTEWIMHEYRLVESLNKCRSKQVKVSEESMRLDDWVLCRIYIKAGSHPIAGQGEEENGAKNIKMCKSFSVSELLIDDADFSMMYPLIEAPLNSSLLDQSPFSNINLIQPFAENMGYFASTLTSENSPKRLKMAESYSFGEFAGYEKHSEKDNASFYDQIFSQYDISQPFFYQQPLMNSQMGKP